MEKKLSSQKEKILLNGQPRQIFGKKLKKLRKEGNIPGNVFGKDFKSQAITVSYKEFVKIYKKAKETGVVYLRIKDKEIPVLIKNVQKHPVNNNILHVDFRKIDLTQKIQTEIPIKIIGVPPAVSEKKGVLLTQTSSILISCLPEKIPSEITIDVSKLTDIGQEIKIADLPITKDYEILYPKEKVIVSITAHKEESITPEISTPPTEEIKKEEETSKETKTETQPSSS